MNRIKATLFTIASLGIALCSCESDVASLTDPGAALVGTQGEIIVDSSFTVSARSVVSDPIQSRTTTQLLGAITAPEYGNLKADFVAQMFPSNNIETENVTPDSLKLQLVFDKTGFVGDSVAPIGIEVYPLTRQLPDPIYSNFSPLGSQSYDPTAPLGSAAFTAVGLSISDTVAANPYRFAYVRMPDALMNNFFNTYKAQPELFNDPYAFQNYFPGVYVRHSFGSGRVTRITNCRMMFYYHKEQRLTNSQGVEVDSITRHYSYIMAMAPELVSNTCINISPATDLTDMAAQGRAIVVAPAALDVELTMPVADVIAAVKRAGSDALTVINTLSFKLPADTIPSAHGINPPGYLLMVKSDEKADFFANNSLPDNITSFIGTYNSQTGMYEFDDMRQYLTKMMQKEQLTPADYTFTLTPVSLVMENSNSAWGYTTTTSLSGITPMIALPAMVELLPAKAKLTLTLSKQQF